MGFLSSDICLIDGGVSGWSTKDFGDSLQPTSIPVEAWISLEKGYLYSPREISLSKKLIKSLNSMLIQLSMGLYPR